MSTLLKTARRLSTTVSRSRVLLLAARNQSSRGSSPPPPKGGKWGRGPKLGQTSVIVQSGFRIRELPLVVQKVNDVLKIDSSGREEEEQAETVEVDDEAAEVMSGFDRCFSTVGVFKLLETIPAEEVTPPVAVHALKTIIALENSSLLTKNKPPSGGGDSFLRLAFINMLLDIVYRCRDPEVILEGLRAVSRDTFPGEQSAAYKERMCEETFVCVSQGHFSLEQISDTVHVLSDFYPEKKKCYEVCDQLWAGIMDKSEEINAGNIAALFSTLPHLKASREIVYKMLESKVGEFWQEYTTKDVLEILGVFASMNMRTGERVLRVLSQWLRVNVQTLSEGETLAVIYCLHKLEYIDDAVIRTMEKYMKVRGVQIKERDLVATICDYCLDFGVCSKPILEGAGEYFIEHGRELSVPQVYSITRVFGELHFHPPNGFKFFEILEHVLEHKFQQFPTKEIIDLLLSFIYIERYPLNFVRKIFNPYFMDRLHNQQPESEVAYTRRQLHLFDTSMNIEAKNYTGPYLPKDRSYKRMPLDHFRFNLAKSVMFPLGEIVGSQERVQLSVVLSSLPLHPLYVIDLMIYPSKAASLLRFGAKTVNEDIVAVLIHKPDHYLRGGDRTKLKGAQAMRVRQLRRMGFKVMQLDSGEIGRRRMCPDTLTQLLKEKYYEALSPTTKSPTAST